MKANELRIGNWVNYSNSDEEPYEEIKIGFGDFKFFETIENGNFTYKYYQPILLTEEWLLKFGFEKDNDKGDYWGIEHFRLWMADENNFYHDEVEHRIQHVHQLQNLYFALTGEELTETPPAQSEQAKTDKTI